MQTQIHALLATEDFSVTVRWKSGPDPRDNDELKKELWGLPHTLVIPSFGETSMVIDAGAEIDLEDILETLRHHDYEPVTHAVL